MAGEWGDIPLQIFRRVVPDGHREFALDSLMLRVFLELDGRKDLGDVAACLDVEMMPLLGAISRLGALGLIDAVQIEVERVESAVFEAMGRALSQELGPVGRVIIAQTLEELGQEDAGFPARKLPELVELLTREIPGDEGKARFRRWAAAHIGRRDP